MSTKKKKVSRTKSRAPARSTSRRAVGRGPSRPPSSSRPRRGRRRRRLRLVTPRRRPPRLPFLLVSVVVVGVLVLGVTSVQALVSQTSFRMQDLSKKTTVLQQDYGRLRLDVARLSSPQRIYREARRLGLTLPGPGDVKTLYVTDPGPPARGGAVGGQPSFALKGVLGSQP